MQTQDENTQLTMPDGTTFVVLESAPDNDAAQMTFEITMAAGAIGPAAIENRVHKAAPTMTDAFAPSGRDRHGACLDCMDLHRDCSFRFLVDLGRADPAGANPRRISSATASASRSSIGPPVIRSR